MDFIDLVVELFFDLAFSAAIILVNAALLAAFLKLALH